MKIVKRNKDNNSIYKPHKSMFEDLFGMPDGGVFSPSITNDSFADVWEEGDNLFVKMAVPAIKEEDLRVTVDNDMVNISAKSHEEEKDDRRYYYRTMESSYEQSFRLPYQVDVDRSEAKLQDGVVTVKLPKSKEQRAKDVKIVR